MASATALIRPTLTTLAGRCRHAFPVPALTAVQFRNFSDGGNSGGGGRLSNFKLRRTPGGFRRTAGRVSDGNDRRGGSSNRGGGKKRSGDGGKSEFFRLQLQGGRNNAANFNPLDPADVDLGIGPRQQQPLLRTHMINLFPGNYEDDGDVGGGGGGPSIAPRLRPSADDLAEEAQERAEREEAAAKAYKEAKEYEEKKQRWLENAKPVVRVPKIDSMGRSYGRGARKRAHCRVWITPGFGNVVVNRKDFIDYFPRQEDREIILDPFVVTSTCGKFDVVSIVRGGGLTGQAGAIRLGVARALQNWDPNYRPNLKKMGYLTRDARKVERKKVGKVKARKSPQWNRR